MQESFLWRRLSAIKAVVDQSGLSCGGVFFFWALPCSWVVRRKRPKPQVQHRPTQESYLMNRPISKLRPTDFYFRLHISHQFHYPQPTPSGISTGENRGNAAENSAMAQGLLPFFLERGASKGCHDRNIIVFYLSRLVDKKRPPALMVLSDGAR
jgi:hypothetical protein